MKLHQWAITRRGRRDENQDAIQFTGEAPVAEEAVCSSALELSCDGVIAAIADGVGGSPDGRLAARTGLRDLCSAPIAQNSRVALERAISAANEQVMALASSMGRPASTLAGISFGAERFLAFNVGDTRVYSYGDDRLKLLTIDHKSTLDGRSITRYLGGSLGQATPHIYELPAEPADFLICSDGFYAFLASEDLLLPRRLDPAKALNALSELAISNGSHDNLSAVFCSIVL
jgi:serine/threonine protein phosphatase PrpC